VDTGVPNDDDTRWVYPGDLVLPFDDAAFRGTVWCINIARLVAEPRADDVNRQLPRHR